MAIGYFKLKVKRRKTNGDIVTATRTQKGIDGTGFSDTFNQSAEGKQIYLTNLQKIITDTIESAVYVEENDIAVGFLATVPAGTTRADWNDIENVKLVNEYTNGDKTGKEQIPYPATNADVDDLKEYAGVAASGSAYGYGGSGEMSAVQGFFTGTTVESAWQED